MLIQQIVVIMATTMLMLLLMMMMMIEDDDDDDDSIYDFGMLARLCELVYFESFIKYTALCETTNFLLNKKNTLCDIFVAIFILSIFLMSDKHVRKVKSNRIWHTLCSIYD